MQTASEQTVRPFHETIVDAIRDASVADFECLVKLIRKTRIPKNHGEIIEAIKANKRWKSLIYLEGVISELIKSVLRQKEEAGAKDTAMHESLKKK